MTNADAVDPSPGDAPIGDPETRIRLLDAAIHIASTQGLDKVTYRSVATQAGLSHSLVRFYFGTGDKMLAQALERAGQLDVEQSELGADTAERFASELLPLLKTERSRVLLQYDYLLRAVRGGMPIASVRAIYDHYIDEVVRTLAALNVEDPDDSIAQTILAAVDGIILQHAIYDSAARTNRMLERTRDLLRLLVRLTDDGTTDRVDSASPLGGIEVRADRES